MKPEGAQHLDRAEELLAASQALLEAGYAADSVSRSYYAVFHAATAVLLKLGIERKSHHALWSAFGQSVTSTGLMDVKFHKIALSLFMDRSGSDYMPVPEETTESAQQSLAQAWEFIRACRDFLNY